MPSNWPERDIRFSLYEKQERSGGLLRYGIPDFKLDKLVIDRRMAQMKTEGVKFHSGIHIGVDIPVSFLFETFDAVVLSGGAEHPRGPGSSGQGIRWYSLCDGFPEIKHTKGAGDTRLMTVNLSAPKISM